MKNYVIEFNDYDTYNANSKEEAIKMFEEEHPDKEITNIIE